MDIEPKAETFDINIYDPASRKRRRTIDNQASSLEDDQDSSSRNEYLVHDPKYYMPSGDCIIRVEDTLFRIHRGFLSRDSSTFDGMFALPQNPLDDSSGEGFTDEQPIMLHGDTVEQFRALLWILYAFPQDIENLLIEKFERISEILAIAEITNKYHFLNFGAWSVRTLKTMLGENTLSPTHHERMLKIAMISDDLDFNNTVISTLTTGLMNGTLDPTAILLVADQHGIRELQGVAYYAQLMSLQKSSNDKFSFPEGSSLGRDQRVCLLAAYWSFVREWDRLRDDPITCPMSDMCNPNSHNHCRNHWGAEWRRFATCADVKKCGTADLLGKLVALYTSLQITVPGFSPPRQTGFFQPGFNIPNGLPHAPQQPGQMSMAMFFQHTQAQAQAQVQQQQQMLQHQANFGAASAQLMNQNNNTTNASTPGTMSCMDLSLAALQSRIDDIRSNLHDYFSDDILGLGS